MTMLRTSNESFQRTSHSASRSSGGFRSGVEFGLASGSGIKLSSAGPKQELDAGHRGPVRRGKHLSGTSMDSPPHLRRRWRRANGFGLAVLRPKIEAGFVNPPGAQQEPGVT